MANYEKEYCVVNENGESIPIVSCVDGTYNIISMDLFDSKIIDPIASKYASNYRLKIDRQEIYNYFERCLKEKRGTLLLNDSDVLIICMYKFLRKYLSFDISAFYKLVIANICKELEPAYYDDYYLSFENIYKHISKYELDGVINRLDTIANSLIKDYIDRPEEDEKLSDVLRGISNLSSSLIPKIKKGTEDKVKESSIYKDNVMIGEEEFKNVLEEMIVDLLDTESVNIPFDSILSLLPIDVIKRAISYNNEPSDIVERSFVFDFADVASNLCKNKNGENYSYYNFIEGLTDYYKRYMEKERKYDEGIISLSL